jgi:hypothetical protein
LRSPVVKLVNQEIALAQQELKITVTASGRTLLDGQEVTLEELETALDAAKIDGAVVRYHRENPTADAPPEAEAVIRMIAAKRLRIGLSTQSDFSDPITVEPPATPKVIEFPGIELLFAKIRKQAAANRGVSLLRPDQILYTLPAPPPGSINPQLEAGVKAMVPSDSPRNIAAISARGALSAGDPTKPPALPDIARQVPFFGLLIGLSYVGHAVWIFEAISTMLPAGCEDADVLLIDSLAVAALPKDWATDAGAIMRNPNILVFDRSRNKVGALRTAGEVPGRLEFPN